MMTSDVGSKKSKNSGMNSICSRATMSALEINAARKEDLNSLTRLAGGGCPAFFVFQGVSVFSMGGLPEKVDFRTGS
jgi:hypothetical protein